MQNKWDRMRINQLVQKIRKGTLTFKKKERAFIKEEKMTDLWGHMTQDDLKRIKKLPPPIHAPKMRLPKHAESYNPSQEFLLSKEEEKEWLEMDEQDRHMEFLPKKFDVLRKVPAYENLIKERFNRCLDLYLCPRARKNKLDIDPESLIPDIPKPSDLKPFPTRANILYKGHTSRVRSIAVNGTGQFLASGDEKGTLIIWDVKTTRKIQTLHFPGIIYNLQWSKSVNSGILAVCVDKAVYLLNPKSLNKRNREDIDTIFGQSKIAHSDNDGTGKKNPLKWVFYEEEGEEYKKGYRVRVELKIPVKQVAFHVKGDYFATVSPNTSNNKEQVYIHSLSKALSQRPFKKNKSQIQKVMFHPHKPLFFIVTIKNVFMYNLQKQILMMKMITGAQAISCIDVHQGGDNLLIGTLDRKVIWYDLDLGKIPYRTFRYHDACLR